MRMSKRMSMRERRTCASSPALLLSGGKEMRGSASGKDHCDVPDDAALPLPLPPELELLLLVEEAPPATVSERPSARPMTCSRCGRLGTWGVGGVGGSRSGRRHEVPEHERFVIPLHALQITPPLMHTHAMQQAHNTTPIHSRPRPAQTDTFFASVSSRGRAGERQERAGVGGHGTCLGARGSGKCGREGGEGDGGEGGQRNPTHSTRSGLGKRAREQRSSSQCI
jgi:hypothetical protein